MQAPAFAFVKSVITISGQARSVSGGRVGLLERQAQRWRAISSGRLPADRGTFAVRFRAPRRPERIAIRVELLSGKRVLASSRAAKIFVELRPLVIPARAVVSAPPPGGAGRVVLHARLPGPGHAGRAAGASSCPTLPSPPQLGQVTTTGYSAAAPYGSLTKINFISVQPPCKITLQTGPATLPQLVGNSGASISYSSLRDVSTGRAASAGTSFKRSLGKAVSCSRGGSASLSGSLSFGITPTLHASFSLFGGLSSASFSVTGSATASLSADVQASVGCSLKNFRLLPPFNIATFQGTIGGWPIVVTLRGFVDANASLSASAHATAGISASESVTGGVGYGKPTGPCAGRGIAGFYPIYCGPTSNPFTFTSPTVSANASATATITPALQALLYGAVGPQVSLTTGLDFNADTTKNPWWKLTAPLNIDGSLVAPILGLSTGSLTLHHSSFTLKTAGGLFNGSTTVNVTNPGNQTGTVGQPVSLQIQASGTDGGALTYNATGLPPGLSINSGAGLISGTPTAGGAYTSSVTAADATGATGTARFSWTIASATNAAVDVATTGDSACALLSTGRVYCWGANTQGALGSGSPTSTAPHQGCGGSYQEVCIAAPQLVSNITNATQISAGDAVCALLADGHIMCWGDNSAGELGDGSVNGPESCFGSSACSTVPVEVAGISNAVQLSVNGATACALLAGGQVDCWGSNEFGQLGQGTSSGPTTCSNGEACSATPVQVLSRVIQVAAGNNTNCAILTGGTVDCWGDNSSGELGNGVPYDGSGSSPCYNGSVCSYSPVAVSGISGAIQIASDGNGDCALLSGGHLECWGANEYGELGIGTNQGPDSCYNNSACSLMPVALSSLTNVTAITAAAQNLCAVTQDGSTYCWGRNYFGEIGNDSTDDVYSPAQVKRADSGHGRRRRRKERVRSVVRGASRLLGR